MSLDWNSIKQEAVNHLQNLLRINTTNPPGNEMEAIKYLASVLKKEGITYQIFESAPNRGNLVARIKGNGNKKPLLLTSHIDVVPAENKLWDVDPFSGEIKDGCIWGRGAVDMKQMTIMELMVFILAYRQGIKLSRDLIYVAVCDEETGGELGAEWLVKHKPELIQAEYALNEVGGFSLYIDNHVFYPIGVAERGVCWFKVMARGDPGHGSMPHDNQAVVKVAEAVERLGKKSLPFHRHPVVSRFLSFLAASQKPPKSWIMKLLNNRLFNHLILEHLIPDRKRAKSFNAMFRNTVSPTILRAGCQVNVIPSCAEFEVDGRILPGQTVESFLKEVKCVLGDDVDIEISRQWNPTEMDYENDFYKTLTEVIKKHDKRAIPVPYLVPGFTDGSHYGQLGIKTYGFVPVRLEKGMNFSEMFHGHNERIPVEGFLFGVQVLWDVIGEACR